MYERGAVCKRSMLVCAELWKEAALKVYVCTEQCRLKRVSVR